SILGMPLRDGDRIMGVLWANSTRPNHFVQHHVELLSLLADQVALVLRNARLYGEVQREKEELETIFSNVSDDIVVFSADHTLRDANPAAARFLGEWPGSLVGKSCRAALQCDQTTSCASECRLVPRSDGAPIQWEIALHNPELVELEVSAVPVSVNESS